MFTGIIETIGIISDIKKDQGNVHLTIQTNITNELKIDQSVSHNGVCLTIVEIFDNKHVVTAIQETINKTFQEYLVNYKYLVRIMENNGFVLLNETEYKQLNLTGSMGNFEQLYNFMNSEVTSNNYLLKKLGNSAQLSDEEKQISFLNNYFIFKKIRNVEYEPDELVSKKQELKEKELQEEVIGEFKKIDEEFEVKEKEKIDEKSKKLAAQYIKETQDLEQQLEEQLEQQQKSKASIKIKLSVDEKLKLAEEKKKAKEEEKLKIAQEKKATKEVEKSLKAETKKSQKTETKKSQKTLTKKA
jgi:hypothetical protein